MDFNVWGYSNAYIDIMIKGKYQVRLMKSDKQNLLKILSDLDNNKLTFVGINFHTKGLGVNTIKRNKEDGTYDYYVNFCQVEEKLSTNSFREFIYKLSELI